MDDKHTGLKHALPMRQMTMIAIGGVIGAGLFVGSGAVIHEMGPAAIVSYLLAGIIVVLIMRMLGEMAIINPTTGSFSEYANAAIGSWAGFTTGWLYWYFWVVVIAIEAIAAGAIVALWFPQLPIWITPFVVITIMMITNLFSVSIYGEFEFWFVCIKVAAIVLFIALGVITIVGFLPGSYMPDVGRNLFGYGGFMPKGAISILNGVVIIIFSFFGVEIATIAAGEANNPKESVARATNSVAFRILFFYVGSISIVVMLLPWQDSAILQSPYIAVLMRLKVPFAAQIMNFVILTAVLSCLNSAIYSSSRMLYALSGQGSAPSVFSYTNEKKVPIYAVLISSAIGYIGLLINYFSPDAVFLFLLNASGGAALFIYLTIAFSELLTRKKIEKDNMQLLKLKMWCYPYLTILIISVLLAILVSMAFVPEMRSQLLLSSGITILLILSGLLRQKHLLNKREYNKNKYLIKETKSIIE
jgi:GABA permease